MATTRINQQETQSVGIHEFLEGLQSIIGRFQTWSAFCEFSDVTECFSAKEEDGLTSFPILDVLEAKIFQYNSLSKGHNVCGNVRYSLSTHRNYVVAILATKAEFL